MAKPTRDCVQRQPVSRDMHTPTPTCPSNNTMTHGQTQVVFYPPAVVAGNLPPGQAGQVQNSADAKARWIDLGHLGCSTPHLLKIIPKSHLAATGCRCTNPGDSSARWCWGALRPRVPSAMESGWPVSKGRVRCQCVPAPTRALANVVHQSKGTAAPGYSVRHRSPALALPRAGARAR